MFNTINAGIVRALGQKLVHFFLLQRMHKVRSNFIQRLQYKFSQMHSRMRYDQIFRIYNPVSKKNYVDIDFALMPSFAVDPSNFNFDFLQQLREILVGC